MENVEKAFWFYTWVNGSAKGWVVVQQPYNTEPVAVGRPELDWRDPTGIELTVYELDELNDDGWLATDAQDNLQYQSFSDYLITIAEEAYFDFPLWKDQISEDFNKEFIKRFYLTISISYKGIFPRFGHTRNDVVDEYGRPQGHSHDYQWSDQEDILHHCQLLQRLLLYASQQGKTWMSQQSTDLLIVTPPPS